MQTWLGIDIGIRNLSCCKLEHENGEWKITSWQLYDLLDFTDNQFTSCNDLHTIDVHTLADYMLPKIFPAEKVTQTINHVCIEQQPHGKYGNQKLVLLSHLIYQHFRRLWYTTFFGSTLWSVRFVSPNSKYCQKWLTKYGYHKEKLYGGRKRLSVDLLKSLFDDYRIQNLTDTVPETTKKADDFADSFLLAFYTAITAPLLSIGSQCYFELVR